MDSSNQEKELVGRDILDSIPDEPKIQLPNYLLDLTNESDGKGNSLYINGVETHIKDLWAYMVKKNKKVNEFVSKKLGVTPSVLYAYKNGGKAISIQMLYKFVDLSHRNKIWNSIFQSEFTLSTHSKHQKTKLPRYITPKLSYILGWICGDGNLKQMHNYLVKISEKSTDQLLILRSLFRELFDVEAPIFKRYKGGYALQIGSKPIYRFLVQVLKIKVGQIPEIIWKMDKVNKKYFLLGIFDSEGCVHSGRFRLSFAQSDRLFLEKIKTIFEKEFDIHCNGPTFHKTRLGEWYTIKVDSKKEFLKFYEKLGSCHIDKKPKIQVLVDKIENRNS